MADLESGPLPYQEKQEHEAGEEKTAPGRYFVPLTDIYETDEALIVVMEMPGVGKDDVEIHVAENVLQVEGNIDFSKYADLKPVYTEYNVGHYSRRFSLSSKIDQSRIAASLTDGVLRVELPKAAEAQPRRIQIG